MGEIKKWAIVTCLIVSVGLGFFSPVYSLAQLVLSLVIFTITLRMDG